MDRELIEHYARGGETLALSIRGLTPEDLLCKPEKDAGVGLWSIQQVLMHLVDCEQVFAERMKRLIAEDDPPLVAFDENKWAAALHYEDQRAADGLALIDLTRRQMATILRKLPDSAFERAGTHSKRGKVTLLNEMSLAVSHLDHHLKFIHAKRAKMGKEMW